MTVTPLSKYSREQYERRQRLQAEFQAREKVARAARDVGVERSSDRFSTNIARPLLRSFPFLRSTKNSKSSGGTLDSGMPKLNLTVNRSPCRRRKGRMDTDYFSRSASRFMTYSVTDRETSPNPYVHPTLPPGNNWTYRCWSISFASAEYSAKMFHRYAAASIFPNLQ